MGKRLDFNPGVPKAFFVLLPWNHPTNKNPLCLVKSIPPSRLFP